MPVCIGCITQEGRTRIYYITPQTLYFQTCFPLLSRSCNTGWTRSGTSAQALFSLKQCPCEMGFRRSGTSRKGPFRSATWERTASQKIGHKRHTRPKSIPHVLGAHALPSRLSYLFPNQPRNTPTTSKEEKPALFSDPQTRESVKNRIFRPYLSVDYLHRVGV